MLDIKEILVVGIAVDSGHEPAFYAEILVQNLQNRREAVGSAGGIGDDGFSIVFLVIDSLDKGRGILSGRGDDDLFDAIFEMRGGFF